LTLARLARLDARRDDAVPPLHERRERRVSRCDDKCITTVKFSAHPAEISSSVTLSGYDGAAG
jgi:hypothetical protein